MTNPKFIFPKTGPSATEISTLIGEAVPQAASTRRTESERSQVNSSTPTPVPAAAPVKITARKPRRAGRKPVNTIDGAKVQMVIDPVLLKSLRIKAVEMETTISKIVEGLVHDFLQS